MSILRDIWHRVIAADDTLVGIEQPIRIQQTLEDSTTYVAEITVADELMPAVTNTRVRAYHVNTGSTEDDGHPMQKLFEGVSNRIVGVSYPHQVTFTCTGPLSKLRRTRTSDYLLTGKTDIQVVKDVLDFCDIDYVSGNIHGHGYTLGAIEDVYWRKGQSGAEIIAELDRVFGCATIENGDGTIFRMRYSRVPADYTAGAVKKVFVRGQVGATFYENERDQGDIDAIQNYWRVSGLSYQGAEGTDDEGCTFQIFAQGIDVHPKLGAGVFVGPEEFQSDFIQSEGLAKEIAQRLMRWYNREPDTLRIVCGNDPDVQPGVCVTVSDHTYGISRGGQRYLVTGLERTGDLMQLDCVGGNPGETGTLTSGIEVCCGTQQEDGTCTDEGTDPSPDDGGGPDLPGFEPTPDHCDPLTDPTCIPGDDYTLPEGPNTEDPYLNCTDSGEGVDLLNSPWRESGDIIWRFDSETNTTLGVYTLSNGTLTYNITPPPAGKNSGNDVLFPGCDVVCVSGTVRFCSNGEEGEDNHSIDIILFPALDSLFGGIAHARFYSEDFLAGYPTQDLFGGEASLELSGGHYDPRAPMHTCAPDLVASGTDGGYMGISPGFETDAAFSVCFDLCNTPPKITWGGDWGSGVKLPLSCPFRPEFDPDGTHIDVDHPHCPHTHHILQVVLGHALDFDVFTDVMCPKVELTSINIGFGTCEENPEYIDLSVPEDLG